MTPKFETDGFRLVRIGTGAELVYVTRPDDGYVRPAPSDATKRNAIRLIETPFCDVGSLLRQEPAGALRALAAPWLPPPVDPALPDEVTCQECHGKRVVEHSCSCDLCEADEEDCPECDGTGKIDNPAKVPPPLGKCPMCLLGVHNAIDARELVAALDGLDDSFVVAFGDALGLEAVRLEGDGYAAIIMGCRP